MEHPTYLQDAPHGRAPGMTRPFSPGAIAFLALEAARGPDGVWTVVIDFEETTDD